MKHRKNWMAWKSKREAELRQKRENQKILNRLMEHYFEEQIKAMHEPGGLIFRPMSPKPKPFFGGKKMVVPIIYGKEKSL